MFFLRGITQLVVQATGVVCTAVIVCMFIWYVLCYWSIQWWHSCVIRTSLALCSLCHPGPCPQCPAFIIKSCICGRMRYNDLFVINSICNHLPRSMQAKQHRFLVCAESRFVAVRQDLCFVRTSVGLFWTAPSTSVPRSAIQGHANPADFVFSKVRSPCVI